MVNRRRRVHGPNRAKGSRFERCGRRGEWSDYQEIRVQEPAGGLSGGSTRAAARAMLVVLEDDLVDKVQAGDDVKMAIIVRRRWHKCAREQRCQVELAWSPQSASRTRAKESGARHQ